ncbi:MAG: GntR family transcriptional regulator [Chelatococcus sp.]|uniref:GntR family transcriptional regulator n=1 Tax=unclassified Chelatococcus TaxID=2638111 RepID=UPI001BCBFA91|nr:MULTISPECIES: GntR family transcriptional regulator [unclassified Chelatococcus]CAH1654027.1 DNA-binding transcriptional regulator, GntR family [Hyphomicrobiales bacterium]MBS7740194.1 GntR family transcriptional regulator [Chelatococcus sp. HY11]MBX3537048.1 GntR family transcriptional regulator [Chelatococcus sp.]MBX3544977.1 GntR family transcriptional regulator [Chelatococcus sp.]MCO5079909.1 GntR family transcriptional regulator [Chelatococcus sp.]
MDVAPNSRNKLRNKIEEDIVNGVFLPGQRMDEVSVAERFGVSRTPVREALMQLASIGLVEIRPRRGAIVAQIGPERLVQMFEVMAEYESMAGRLAARRYTDADRVAISIRHAACADAVARDDSVTYYEENEAFHFAIYAASHNDFLIEQATALHRRLKPYRRRRQRFRKRMHVSFAEHEQIVDAIFAMDGERASGLLRSHIIMQGEQFNDFIASLHLDDTDDQAGR